MQLRVCWKHRLKIALNHALFVLRAQGLSDCVLHVYVCSHTLSFWTHFLAIVFIFELTYVAAVSQRWEIWGGTLCSSVLWDSLFHWALHSESVPMVAFWCTGWFWPSCLYPFSLFLSCRVPWGWSDLHNLWEQNRDLTSLSYSCTARYWMVKMKECWRNICIVVQDKYDKQ